MTVSIPWRKTWNKLVELALLVIRATGPEKPPAPPPEPTPSDAFDRWKDGRP